MKKTWLVGIATLGPVGNFKGCGTLATVLTLPLVYGIYALGLSSNMQLLLLSVVCIGALLIVNRAIDAFPGDHDPSAIVIDEVVGCLVTFYDVPLHWGSLMLGFMLFRILDITKPFGIDWLERCAGPWGIVLDDLVAAVIANIVLQFVFVC